MNCINCKKKKFKKIVKLGSQPLSGIFHNKKIFSLKKYSLDLYQCKFCDLVQLKKVANKNIMFGKSYEYRTSLSKLMKNHIKKKFFYLKKKKIIKSKSSILDIGSNDGTFLNFFSKSNSLLGMDPTANKFKSFYKKNIRICNKFFSKKNVDNFLKKKKFNSKKFDLISSFAMFYDVENPNKFCKDIFSLLNKDGVWILELSYLPLMLKNLTYDQICHEHIAYYTLTSFKNLVEQNEMKIIDINFNEINGGSIEIFVTKKNSKFGIKRNKIHKVLIDEKKINFKSYKNFNSRINKNKSDLQKFIKKSHIKNKKIICYGASTKGNIVLNHCKISNKKIRYICDGSSKKIGSYTPGTNLEIISKEKMRQSNPNYLLVLIWSFKKEVIHQEINFLKNGGELVFHLPRFHIVNKNNYKNSLKSSFKKFSYKY